MLRRVIQGDTILFYEGEKLVLTIEELENENGILMTLKGDLISEAAHHIQDELDAFTTVGVRVTMDFGEVAFAAPSVFNGLLNSQQLIDFFRQGEIVLKNVPDVVYQEMDATGISELLMIED